MSQQQKIDKKEKKVLFISFLKKNNCYREFKKQIKKEDNGFNSLNAYIKDTPADELISGAFIWDDPLWSKLNAEWEKIVKNC